MEHASQALTVFSATSLLLSAMHILVISTAIWSAFQGRWTTVFPAMLFAFIAAFIGLLYVILKHDTAVGKILSIIIILVAGALIVNYYILTDKAFCIDIPAWNIFLAFVGIGAGIMAIIINIIELILKRVKKHAIPSNVRMILATSFIVSLFFFCGFSTNWFDPYYHVTVPEGSDGNHVKLSFWSHINTSYYNSTQLQQLENHEATIIAYTTNRSEFNQSFTWAQELRDNYPKINLMWPLFGGYYNWEEIENDTYMYLDAIDDYNLTNTRGFVFDLERHNDTCWHDWGAYQNLIEALNRSLTAIRAKNSNYKIDNTAGIWMMFTHLPMGGGEIVEVYKQHAVMSFESTWDGYQWQLYRGNAVDPASDPDSTNMYERMLSSVRQLGANKTIPIFGMTGVGDYGPNNCSLTNGSAVPCNFAGVIKDCRLARSLGITEVAFFTLCDADTWQGVYYPSMFEAYGQNFLDTLNDSVNGLTEPIQIKIPGKTAFRTTVGYFWEQVSYAITPWNALYILGIASTASLLLAFKDNIKSKNEDDDRNMVDGT